MTAETHSQLANFIWSIRNLLRGPYKRRKDKIVTRYRDDPEFQNSAFRKRNHINGG